MEKFLRRLKKKSTESKYLDDKSLKKITAAAGYEGILFKENTNMKMTRFKKKLSLILCIVLIAAIALFTTGCTDNTVETPDEGTKIDTENFAENESNMIAEESSELGEGETEFIFTVTDIGGKETKFQIHTDKKTVGEALLELNLISGEAGPYGLYVKTVNGDTFDFDKDGKYWAFYINGELGATGVDATDITEGATYSFKVE